MARSPAWRRALDAATQVLPVLGSREALFAFGQTVIDGSRPGATVVVPNPFYQIYEGAALLAGAQTYCVNADAQRGFAHRWDDVPADVWNRTQLLYVCSPDNPTGRVMPLGEWRELFALSDRYGFVIASDECYSEIHFDEAKPPLGALAAAQALGRDGFPRLVVFGSLSKRSNAPGLRSGYAAGDRALIKAFLHYRTYHGSAMSGAVAEASIAAWSDEAHVVQNRAEYAAKFALLAPRLAAALPCAMPEAAFYLWAQHARRRRCVRAPPARRGERRRVARQLRRARRARRESRRRTRSHRACRRSLRNAPTADRAYRRLRARRGVT